MSLITILETIFIGPLKLCFEIIFSLANRIIGHPGLSIIVLSLIMNILVLPLYKRADAMQEESRDIEAKLSKGVSHIKKTFSGDERMMILQTYYRQNNYQPTDALNGSVSLLLEIPFFMAAYQFLSHLDILNGVSLGPIQDLGAPDGLLVIGGIAINVLPFLMTTVNIVSSALYLKGFPLKTKIQLYGMALFFLVFLYESPSCLVFYWTLNNVFSLVKTIFYKLKNPQKVLRWGLFSVGATLFVFVAFFYSTSRIKLKLFLAAISVLMQMPMIVNLLKGRFFENKIQQEAKPDKRTFVMSGVFLTVLVGLLIPSTFIAASPQEYVDISYFHNPLLYLVSSVSLAGGFFLVWMGVFYWLANPKGKVVFDKLLWILCGVMLANYMFFGTNLGVISSDLQYEEGMHFTVQEQIVNIVAIGGIAILMYLLSKKWSRMMGTVLLTAIIAVTGMSTLNIMTTRSSISQITADLEESTEIPNFTLSTQGKNVIVLMLDRAMGEYLPYLFNEKPELVDKFDGFTYYPNTIGYGGTTNFGTPPLLGGYEYTPVEMNKRDSELLADKHNEALKVMPVLFAENGFEVTVCDPVYANYRWIPDLSIFDEYDEINAYISKGKFSETSQKERTVANNHRNFFVFSMMKSMPLFVQTTIYNNGRYNQAAISGKETVYKTQELNGISKATGITSLFMESYNVMTSLSNITKIENGETNTFLFMVNDMTHDPILLQTPEYVPADVVDNTEYDAANADRFVVNGRLLRMENEAQMIHYHSNMAAMQLLGKWFDYLRENDVYDNTKIIIVSDHGRGLGHLEEVPNGLTAGVVENVEYFMPLLLVKDFNATGFTTSDAFMTNADVPTLAFENVIESPINPFTGKTITSDEKYAHDQFIVRSYDWDIAKNNGYTFLPAKWVSIKENIWDPNNWVYYDESIVLTEHAFPN